MEFIRNTINGLLGRSEHTLPAKQPADDKSTRTFTKTEQKTFFGKHLSLSSITTSISTKVKEFSSKYFSTNSSRITLAASLISEKKYEQALHEMKGMNEASIIKVLNKSMESDRTFLTTVRDTFIEVSKVSEEHKLNPQEVLTISIVAQVHLNKAVATGSSETIYIKQKTGLPRAICIIPNLDSFYILNKRKVIADSGNGILSFLGKGSFKKVTTAIEVTKMTGTQKAKSVAQAVNLDRKSAFDEIEKEGRVATLLNHPNVVSARSIFRYTKKDKNTQIEQDKTSIMMERCETDLKNVRKTFQYNDENRCQIFEGLANGIHYMHTFKSPFKKIEDGIVHRDIKGANILIKIKKDPVTNKTIYIPKIGDYGKVANFTTVSERVSRYAYGTDLYIAPEKHGEGARTVPITKAQDMYALGCALYEFEYNTDVPWMKKNKREDYQAKITLAETLSKNLPETWEGINSPKEMRRYIISRLLDPDPAKRMNSGEYVKAAEHLRKITDITKK